MGQQNSRTASARSTASQTRRRAILAGAIAIPLSALSPALAGDAYWDTNADTAGSGATPTGVWGVDAFWTLDSTGSTTPTTAWTANDVAIFAAGADAAGAYTVTVDSTTNGPLLVGGITFEDGDATLSGGQLDLTGATPTINVAAPTAAIGSILAGTTGLTKTGVGALTLSGVNTFSGTVAIDGGTLSVGADTALGAGTNAISLNGGTLNLTATIGADQANANTRGITLTGNGTIDLSAGGATWHNGVITGTGSLTKTGTTSLVLLNQSNNYTGDTIIKQGTVVSSGINSLGATTNQIVLDAIAGQTATFRMAALPTDYTETRNLVLQATGGRLDASNPTATNATYAGVISGNFELTKIGAGTMNLTAANTYTGGTILQSGTTAITADSNLGAGGTGVTFTGGTLRLDAPMTFSRAITMTGNGGINTNGNDSTLSSVISGNGNFTKSGAGRMTLTSSNPAFGPGGATAGGRFTVSAGTLVIPSGAPADVLGLAGLLNTAATLENNTAVSNGATLEITGTYNAADQIYIVGDGVSGGGALRKVGNNITTFAGKGITLNAGNGRVTAAEGELVLSNGVLSRSTATGLPGVIFDGAGDIRTTASTEVGNWNIAVGGSKVTKEGTGILTLGGISSFTGGLVIRNGTVRFNADTTANGSQQLGSTPDIGANDLDVDSVILDGGTLEYTNTATVFGNANRGMQITDVGGSVRVANAVASLFTGTLQATPGATNSVLTKTGQGEFRFNGSATNPRTLTTYHKLAVNEGLFRLGSVAGFDVEQGFGAIPGGPLSDAITLNGGAIGLSFNTTLHANRGITLGTGAIGTSAATGGVINGTSGQFTIPGIVSGAGTLHVIGGASLVNGGAVLTGVNTYTGRTVIGSDNVVQFGGIAANTTGTLHINSDAALGAIPGSPDVNNVKIGTATATGTLSVIENTTIDSNRGLTIGALGGTVSVNVDKTATYGGILAGTGNFTKSSAGTLVLNGANSYTGNTTVGAGTLVFGQSHTTSPSVTVAAGATMRLATNGNNVLKTSSLSVPGKLDMTDNDLIVDYTGASVEAAIRQLVKDGRVPAATSGIFSTPGDPDDDKVIAVADNAAWGKSQFNGIDIDTDTVVGKYTYFGDANLDGKVTGDDYVSVDANLGTGDSWLEGDFNMNGVTTGDDYVAIDANLGKGTPTPLAYAELKEEMVAQHVAMFGEEYLVLLAQAEAEGFGASVVPEPTAISLIGLGAVGLLGRRRRSR